MLDDSVLTINNNVFEPLVERMTNDQVRYCPSYVTKIIHRSIREENLRKVAGIPLFQRKRGVFCHNDPSLQTAMRIQGHLTISEGESKVKYVDIPVPGPHLGLGIEIFSHLDAWYQEINFQNTLKYDIFKIASAMGIFIAASHNFFDGNGRVSIGLSKAVIDAFTDRKVSLQAMHDIISLRNSTTGLESGLFCLIPEPEAPESYVRKMIKKRNDNQKFPCLHVINFNNYSLEERDDFLKRYSRNIISNIDHFREKGSLKTPKLNEALHNYSYLLSQATLQQVI